MKKLSAFTLAICFLCGFTIPNHIYLANLVLEDARDGRIFVGENEPPIILDKRLAKALREYPEFFRGGSIGPDGFPDILVGQMYIHADLSDPGNDATSRAFKNAQRFLPHSQRDPQAWRSIDWAMELLDLAWIDVEKRNADKESLQALAFAYGFLCHYAGDTMAHHFVNWYANGEWDFLDNDPFIELRHTGIEKFIELSSPQNAQNYSTKIACPENFIRKTLLNMNPKKSKFAKATGSISVAKQLYEIQKYCDEKIREYTKKAKDSTAFEGVYALYVKQFRYWHKTAKNYRLNVWLRTSTTVAQKLANGEGLSSAVKEYYKFLRSFFREMEKLQFIEEIKRKFPKITILKTLLREIEQALDKRIVKPIKRMVLETIVSALLRSAAGTGTFTEVPKVVNSMKNCNVGLFRNLPSRLPQSLDGLENYFDTMIADVKGLLGDKDRVLNFVFSMKVNSKGDYICTSTAFRKQVKKQLYSHILGNKRRIQNAEDFVPFYNAITMTKLGLLRNKQLKQLGLSKKGYRVDNIFWEFGSRLDGSLQLEAIKRFSFRLLKNDRIKTPRGDLLKQDNDALFWKYFRPDGNLVFPTHAINAFHLVDGKHFKSGVVVGKQARLFIPVTVYGEGPVTGLNVAVFDKKNTRLQKIYEAAVKVAAPKMPRNTSPWKSEFFQKNVFVFPPTLPAIGQISGYETGNYVFMPRFTAKKKNELLVIVSHDKTRRTRRLGAKVVSQYRLPVFCALIKFNGRTSNVNILPSEMEITPKQMITVVDRKFYDNNERQYRGFIRKERASENWLSPQQIYGKLQGHSIDVFHSRKQVITISDKAVGGSKPLAIKNYKIFSYLAYSVGSEVFPGNQTYWHFSLENGSGRANLTQEVHKFQLWKKSAKFVNKNLHKLHHPWHKQRKINRSFFKK